ncbi:aldehyde ferredoxin oxidoreductase C-terminal domain-containing protein [Chloroflexota bacterium]
MAEQRFNLLEVNLSSGQISTTDISKEFRQYVGGRGSGAKLLWDRVPQGADSLGSENVLYFGLGPITGFCGAVVNVNAKSPLTLLRGESNLNGHFGTELIYAGYNGGLLISGRADKPVYLYIKDREVEIRDASHLWGKLQLETQYALKQELRRELDDQNFRIASIGPAGEHSVRNAEIGSDFYHHAARLGMGAVMGSKNLKAIAVRGTRPPRYANPAKLFQMLEKFFKEGRLFKATERRWGHSWSIPDRYYKATEGIKNKQLGWHDICNLSNPIRLEQQYKLWNDGCMSCPAGCKVPYMRREPPLGPCAGEIRHDNAGGWMANVMIPGYDIQAYLTPFIDNLGLDSEDVSGVVAWMMECYEKGIVTKDDLDGIDLSWGNLKAICTLVKKIAYRDGIGNVLAEGLRFAPQQIGKGSERYAMTHKGVAITSYEPRGDITEAVQLAVVPFGELHGGRGQPERVMFDSLTACTFTRPTIRQVFGHTADWGIEMLNAACGWDLTKADWNSLVRRIVMMERCYCMREGYVPARDDDLPDRFFEETIYDKYGAEKFLDRNLFLAERKKWYQILGLTKDGIPTRDYLKGLGLEFAIDSIPVADNV